MVALVAQPDSVRVVILDVSQGQLSTKRGLELAGRFSDYLPGIVILLVSDEPENLALPALRAGVKDVLESGLSVSEFRWAIRRAQEGGPDRDVAATPHAGRVITVASPKGGVGKTTMATNIARALAERSPNGTVVVDLDTQFGDVAAALDLDPTYTLGDLLVPHALADGIALKALLTKHSSGLHVAPGVKSPEEADGLRADLISQLLDNLKAEFRYVVVDTAPGMTELALAAIDHSTDLVLMTSLDVPGVRGLRKVVELLEHLDLPPMTRQIVVNMADKGAGLSVGDVEATVGQKVDLVIPRDLAVVRSTNSGSPIVESAPRHKVAKELQRLVSRFAPGSARSSASNSAWKGLHRGQVAAL
nr:AAA family ATPase [Ornithinimicrobium sp. HY1745]